MSEKIVVFRDNQELQANDFLNMQSWLQSSLDHVVLDAINDDRAYSGFNITKSTVSQLSVATGRLYDDGAVYVRDSVVTLDLYNDLPVATEKWFAIVAWGTTVNEDIQPRNFLIDADTGEAEPQSVAMRTTRYANINYVKGTESADPQYPTIEATTLLIGYVLCDPTGIQTIVQNDLTQIDNLRLVAGRTGVLEAWRSILAGMVDTLRTDLGNLAQKLLLFTPLTEFQHLTNVVADLADRVGRAETSVGVLANTYFHNSTDYFHDDSQSDTDGSLDSVNYSARVEDGLRFPGGATGWQGLMALGNLSDPLVMTTADNLVLPRPSGTRVRYDVCLMDVDDDWIEHRILAHAHSHSFTCHHLRPSRWRWRCGPHYLPVPTGTLWWHIADFDPIIYHLAFADEIGVWAAHPWSECEDHDINHPHWARYNGHRWKHLWHDFCHLPYWDRAYTDHNHSGYHMVHSFFNAEDGWLAGVTFFMLNSTSGAFKLTITECDDDGVPDHANRTIRRVEVVDEDACDALFDAPIHPGDIWGEEIIVEISRRGEVDFERIYHKLPKHIYPLRVPISPVFLRAGRHYAIHIDTTVDFKFAASEHYSAFLIHGGHLWHWDNDTGKFACWLSTPRSLRFKLHYCTWGMWGAQTNPGGQLRYNIDLAPLLLAGGIGSIDVLAESIVPEATNLNYEIKTAAGQWTALAGDPSTPDFDPAPTQLYFRACFQGTVDLMPAVSMAESQVTLTTPQASTFHHFSEAITCPSTSAVKIVVRLVNYNETNHDLECNIHYGATHDDTPDGDDSSAAQADGSILRTFTFNTSTLTSFQVELHGTVTTGEPFVIAERKVFTKIT